MCIYIYVLYVYILYLYSCNIYISYITYIYNISLTTQKAECFKNFLRANFGPQDPKHPAFTSWAWMRIWFRRSLGIGSVGQICWRKMCTKVVLSIVVCGSPGFFWVVLVGPGRWFPGNQKQLFSWLSMKQKNGSRSWMLAIILLTYYKNPVHMSRPPARLAIKVASQWYGRSARWQQWRSIDGGRKMETPIFWMVFKRPYLHSFSGISMSAWKSLAISSRLVDPLTKDPNTQQVASRKLFPRLAPTLIHHLSFTQTMNKNITFHSPNKKKAQKKGLQKALFCPSLPTKVASSLPGLPRQPIFLAWRTPWHLFPLNHDDWKRIMLLLSEWRGGHHQFLIWHDMENFMKPCPLLNINTFCCLACG